MRIREDSIDILSFSGGLNTEDYEKSIQLWNPDTIILLESASCRSSTHIVGNIDIKPTSFL